MSHIDLQTSRFAGHSGINHIESLVDNYPFRPLFLQPLAAESGPFFFVIGGRRDPANGPKQFKGLLLMFSYKLLH